MKILPQTHSPEVEYSLFIMVMMVDTLEIEIPPVTASAHIHPPILAGFGSILVFRCFCRALLEEASGSSLYRGF
jgi:hypothetical protein